ncbi:hypothetical protein niasHT_013100 [Heterodera trifolii]|uniref:Uncharacterized protein n=1 Tax=Heterodera trifolii TaxID=157864 RepID=A0ABD2L797_9BILA
MRHIEKRAQNLRNRCMRETLTLFYKPENRAKIEKCAGRLLRQRERVVLSREDLNNVFVSRVSTDERWNSPPVRTSPNFGHFSILEKNCDEKAKGAHTFPMSHDRCHEKPVNCNKWNDNRGTLLTCWTFGSIGSTACRSKLCRQVNNDEKRHCQLRAGPPVARGNNILGGGGGGQEAMMAKVERAKRLANETMELGTERVAKVKQVNATS